MAENRTIIGGRHASPVRIAALVGVTVLILLVPLIAMQFTNEVNWTASDFVFAGVMIIGTGLIYEFAAGRLDHAAYRFAIGMALGGAFLLIWVNGAVGIIGSEDHPANLLYGAVLGAGLAGAIVSRFEPAGMTRAMFAVALVHGLVAVIALFAGPKTLVINWFFIALWLVSAVLFGNAARDVSSRKDHPAPSDEF